MRFRKRCRKQYGMCIIFASKKALQSFYFPENGDVLCLPKDDVLTKVTPTTATGRFYELTIYEVNWAS